MGTSQYIVSQGGRKMLIKVNIKDGDCVVTKINANIKQIAEYYFANRNDIESVEILKGGNFENEYYIKKPLKIWRVDKKVIKEFNLQNNIRLEYEVTYKKDKNKVIGSYGLANIC